MEEVRILLLEISDHAILLGDKLLHDLRLSFELLHSLIGLKGRLMGNFD